MFAKLMSTLVKASPDRLLSEINLIISRSPRVLGSICICSAKNTLFVIKRKVFSICGCIARKLQTILFVISTYDIHRPLLFRWLFQLLLLHTELNCLLIIGIYV